MFLVLRVAAVVVAIYWLSPAREQGETPRRAERPASVLPGLEAVPTEHRAEAIEGLARLGASVPELRASLSELAAALARKEALGERAEGEPKRRPEKR
jgi:hypothetical protein